MDGGKFDRFGFQIAGLRGRNPEIDSIPGLQAIAGLGRLPVYRYGSVLYETLDSGTGQVLNTGGQECVYSFVSLLGVDGKSEFPVPGLGHL